MVLIWPGQQGPAVLFSVKLIGAIMRREHQSINGIGAFFLKLVLFLCCFTHPAFAEGPMNQVTAITSRIPLVLPRTELVYEAIFDLAPTLSLGDSPLGTRFIVPITGGVFHGPKLNGKVLPGGADRQLLRKDGVKRLDALYELQTDDGAIITVHNKVLADRDGKGYNYTFSNIDIVAPDGKYAWLNRSVYVGTLHSLRPERAAVLIRVYRLI
jgi:hypothetical protein